LTQPLRFLLDQQFPPPRFDIHALDRSVVYTHLSDHNRRYSTQSTPDWMLHLVAAEGGFDGVVTLDRSQLEEEAELVALASARISVVTWDRGDEDPIVLWGQLLAYMPQVVKVLDAVRPAVITLPNPRLGPSQHVQRPEEMVRAMQARDHVSYPERRSRAVTLMHAELEKRGETALARHLEKKPGRSAQKRASKAQVPARPSTHRGGP
jgi:hypothetical protein